jgi:hypothetical protein
MRTVANTYTMHFLYTRKHFNGSAAMTEIRVEGYPKYIITTKCEISNYITEKCAWVLAVSA